MSVIELREYRVFPGKFDAWTAWMKSELLPHMQDKGMKILQTTSYVDEDGEQWFIWLREFESEEHRQALYKETYNEWWVQEVRPKVFEHIEQDSMRVRVLESMTLVESN